MKFTKKLMSMLVALIMVFTLATPAFAAMEGTLEGGSISITNAVDGQTYSAYQILYLESYNKDAGTYAYKANSAWKAWLETQKGYVTIDDQGYVTWVKGANVDEFAKLAQEKLSGKTADKTATAADGTATLSGLNLGYYLVDTTLGTLCSLDTTNPTVAMKEKNEAPTITKDVQEDSNNTWGDKNDADINQTVNFKATVTVKKGAENYTVHDTMSAGLTYKGVTAVKIGDADVAADNYTVSESDTCDGGCTFEVAFKNEYISTLAVGTEIVIEYSATLNENAVVGLPGNDNKVYLKYGDANKLSSTPVDKTTTFTWDMGVLKYGNNDETKVLKDAKFVLLNSDKSKVAKITDGKLVRWDAVTDDMDLTPYELVTGDDGKITIKGLDADKYYLRETQAPAGYNKLSADVKVTVTGIVDGTHTAVVAKINNQSGTVLPSTGGIGTTLFYIVGGIMVVGAVVALITKKRMEE